MKPHKISINKIFFIAIGLNMVLCITIVAYAYITTFSGLIIYISIIESIVAILSIIGIIISTRKKVVEFSEQLCQILDEMVNGSFKSELKNCEEVYYKLNHRLVTLYEIMQSEKEQIAQEQLYLKEMISDISHQVKTPIANLKIINSTLLNEKLPSQVRNKFLCTSETQLEKLDFLMQALIKISRLETGVISLNLKNDYIYETLANALGGILYAAEMKRITVNVECPENLVVFHDNKWTTEALFNILDNAVKYTQEGGKIDIAVKKLEFYVKIDILDNGIGIPESIQGAIFRRFYRGANVGSIEGIGIGLYLCKEIVSMQQGYIKVVSKEKRGSQFSIYLPIKNLNHK